MNTSHVFPFFWHPRYNIYLEANIGHDQQTEEAVRARLRVRPGGHTWRHLAIGAAVSDAFSEIAKTSWSTWNNTKDSLP